MGIPVTAKVVTIPRTNGMNIASLGEMAIRWHQDPCMFVLPGTTNNYAYLHKYPTTQCLSILHTGTFSQVDCTLSPHCGTTIYQKISSTWYGLETGVCIGAGADLDLYVSGSGTEREVSPGWGQIIKVTARNLLSIEPNLILDGIKTADGYYLYYNETLNQYPQLNSKFEHLFPTNIDFNSPKLCIPIIEHSKYPIMLGPYKDLSSACPDMMYFFNQEVKHKENPTFCLDKYTCIGPTNMIVDFNSQIITCNEATQTTNLLPISFSYISKTAGHLTYTVLASIWHVLISAIEWAFYYLAKIADPFIFIVTVLFNAIKLKHGVLDSMIYSLIVAIIVANVHNIEMYRRKFSLLYS